MAVGVSVGTSVGIAVSVGTLVAVGSGDGSCVAVLVGRGLGVNVIIAINVVVAVGSLVTVGTVAVGVGTAGAVVQAVNIRTRPRISRRIVASVTGGGEAHATHDVKLGISTYVLRLCKK